MSILDTMNEDTPKNAKNNKLMNTKRQLKGAQFLYLACQGVACPPSVTPLAAPTTVSTDQC